MQRARLAQSVEHETLNLRVVGSSPTLGAGHFFATCFKELSVFTTVTLSFLFLVKFGVKAFFGRFSGTGMKTNISENGMFCSKNNLGKPMQTVGVYALRMLAEVFFFECSKLSCSTYVFLLPR